MLETQIPLKCINLKVMLRENRHQYSFLFHYCFMWEQTENRVWNKTAKLNDSAVASGVWSNLGTIIFKSLIAHSHNSTMAEFYEKGLYCTFANKSGTNNNYAYFCFRVYTQCWQWSYTLPLERTFEVLTIVRIPEGFRALSGELLPCSIKQVSCPNLFRPFYKKESMLWVECEKTCLSKIK